MEATMSESGGKIRHRADKVLDQLFDELVLGEWFRSRRRTITEADVMSFAALTGDWHPAHSDAVWAAENLFGERVAHGMLLLAYAVGLVPNDNVAALRRVSRVVYKHPVKFGDTIYVEGTVARLRPFSEELGLVTGRWKVINQDHTTVMKMELEALWRRKPE
jgi:3-hydroxybutyryl-CoA dehydratase